MPSDYSAITEYNERQLGLDTASRKTQISMYSDPTHFIYELLQNADDYGAAEIFFSLSKNKLVVEHDGSPFTEQNVKAITYFGKSTSADDLVKTGRFGVGFKSVFAFTATPIVISGDEHFQIHGLYRIKKYSYPSGFSHSKTRIILPFNHTSEQPDYVDELITEEDAYTRISNRLVGLNMDALLFTQNIREIRWEIEGRSGHYLREDIIEAELRRTTIADSGERLNEYLVFSKVPEWKGQKHKSVEVAFSLDKKGQIVPVESDYLYVLFATTQETHLQFILNGPFRTNPSRETISEEDLFNKHLMAEICCLIKGALSSLKKRGLLTTQFLSILPNNTDKLRGFYDPLQTNIVESFCSQPFIPTDDNQYALSSKLFQGSGAIRKVIKKDELAFLVGDEHACWVKGVRQNSRADTFLKMLNIRRWDWNEMLTTMNEKFGKYEYNKHEFPGHHISHYLNQGSLNELNDMDLQWLDARSDLWLRSLYALIADYIKRDGQLSIAQNLQVIRVLENNDINHVTSSNAYFPKPGYLHLPQVKKEIMAGVNNQDVNDQAAYAIKQTMILLGVSEIGDEEAIENTLETHYADTSTVVAHDVHWEHIASFIKWWKKGGDIKIFNNRAIFISPEVGGRHKASECFLDTESKVTGLSQLFASSTISSEKKKLPLWERYDDIAGFAEFAEASGVMTSLEIREYYATKMQLNIFPVIGMATDTTIDRDYFINGLEGNSSFFCWHKKTSEYYLGGLKLNKPCIELSRAVWNTLYYTKNSTWAVAFYRPNQSNKDKEKKSESFLLNQLLRCAWVPDKNGGFRLPHDSTKESLPVDFPTDNSRFLKVIHFDTREQLTSQENTQKLVNARALGFNLEDVDFMKKMKKNPTLLDEYKRKLEQDEIVEAFPENSSKNPERRKRKIQEKVIEAAQKKTIKKVRSVNASRVEIDARSYLKNQYTNSDRVLVCQLCHSPMPFKKRDGEYYMEAVEVVGYYSQEVEELYLALCPNCAAKYKYFIKKSDQAQEQIVAELLQTDTDSISLSLGEENATLRFVETHLTDVKAILEKFVERQ